MLIPESGIGAPDVAARIGHAVKRLRRWHDMTQGELAKRVSVSQGTISLMEKGKSLNFSTLDAVSRALGLKLSELIEFAESLED